jgi:hypothetical protein
MTSIVVCIFAVLLCLINVAVWTLVSQMPLVGLGWGVAAVVCIALQKWSRG